MAIGRAAHRQSRDQPGLGLGVVHEVWQGAGGGALEVAQIRSGAVVVVHAVVRVRQPLSCGNVERSCPKNLAPKGEGLGKYEFPRPSG